MDTKDKKKRFGVTMAPTQCTEAWVRSMAFDHNEKGIKTYSYIVVNRYLGTRTHINTYNGGTGSGYNAANSTHQIKGWGTPEADKDLAKSLQLTKDNPYKRCLISDCPAAVFASPPPGWTGDLIVEPPLPSEPISKPATESSAS